MYFQGTAPSFVSDGGLIPGVEEFGPIESGWTEKIGSLAASVGATVSNILVAQKLGQYVTPAGAGTLGGVGQDLPPQPIRAVAAVGPSASFPIWAVIAIAIVGVLLLGGRKLFR